MIIDIFPNWASLDGVLQKFEDLSESIIGSEAVQVQVMTSREALRDVLGSKTMQEILPK